MYCKKSIYIDKRKTHLFIKNKLEKNNILAKYLIFNQLLIKLLVPRI